MQHSKEWHELRRKGITGSDVGIIIGVSKWSSPLELYMRKLDMLHEQEMTKRMYYGNRLESFIAEEYSIASNNKVTIEENTLVHKDNPLMIGNIDRWIGDKEAILECKNVGMFAKDEWGEQYTDQIPDVYKCQIAWYVAICDVPYAELAAFGSGNELRIYRYERDLDFERSIIEACMGFWHNHIVKQIPPQQGSSSDFNKLYPIDDGSSLLVTDEQVELIQQLKELQDYKKELAVAMEDIQTTLQSQLGDSTFLVDTYDNVLVTWKTAAETKRLDSAKLKEENPDIYKKYIKVTDGIRRFLLK